MFLAEIHGKLLADARDNEDYLTSSVFGHLRYIPPGSFWKAFLVRCRSLPHEGTGITAYAYLSERAGMGIEKYGSLRAIFWPRIPKDEPDLMLVFTGPNLPALVVCVEAKLNAGKSGRGEKDQLARYLRACDSLDCMRPQIPKDAISVVVYLTTHDSRSELLDSLLAYGESSSARCRLYGLEWQDVLSAAEESQPAEKEPSHQILHDMVSFLRALNLTHFSGMTKPVDFGRCDGRLFALSSIFSRVDVPSGLENVRGGWIHERG